MATETSTSPSSRVAQERPAPVKLPPPSGRPKGKGLESITRGDEKPSIKRVAPPDREIPKR